MSRQTKYEAPEVAGMIERSLKALARRAGEGEAEAVESLRHLEHVVGVQLGVAVNLHRLGPAKASWATIAELVGTSRSAAFQRFGSVVIEGERCSDHPAYEADNCPGCGTSRKIGGRP